MVYNGILMETIVFFSRAGVLTFYPTHQIFLPRLIAHARINIASVFSRLTTIFNVSALLKG